MLIHRRSPNNFFSCEFFEGIYHDGNRHSKRQHITDSLTHFDSQQPEKHGQSKNQRYEKQPLPASCKDIGTYWFPTRLCQHVAANDKRTERIGAELPAECHNTDGYHLWVVAEKPYQRTANQPPNNSNTQQENGS